MWVMVLTNNDLVLNKTFPLKILKIYLLNFILFHVVMMHFSLVSCLSSVLWDFSWSCLRCFLIPDLFWFPIFLVHNPVWHPASATITPSYLFLPPCHCYLLESHFHLTVPASYSWLQLCPILCFLSWRAVSLLWQCENLEGNMVWFPTWNLFRLSLLLLLPRSTGSRLRDLYT